MTVRLLSKGDCDQVSGGYLYNRYVMDHLRRTGYHVIYHGSAEGLGEIDADDDVVVDSLAIEPLGHRLLGLPARLILLLHVVPGGGRTGAADTPDAFRELCRRSRIVLTGHTGLGALLQSVPEAILETTQIEPGVPKHWHRKRSYPARPKRLLCLANYLPGKGHERLLETLRRLRGLNWTLRAYGNRELDPAYFAHISERVEALGLSDRVELRGAIPHAGVNREMLRADLLVHFSAHETYSMVTAEAIAAGLPVVSYRTGNAAAFARSGLVRHVEPGGDREALVLRALIQDGAAYRRLRPARPICTRTWHDVGREFMRLLGPG